MADKGNLAESHEWFGYFAPAGAPEGSARPGRLSYTPEEGLTLRLIGGFQAHILPAIIGNVEKVPVTLVDCVATSARKGVLDDEPTRQTIDVQSAIFGIFLNDPDTACFDEMDIELEHLSQWAAEKDFELRFDWGNGGEPPAGESPNRRWSILYHLRRRLRRTVGNDLSAVATAENSAIDLSQHDGEPTRTSKPQRRSWGMRVQRAEPRSAQIGDELNIELRRRYVLPNFDEYRDRAEMATSGSSVLQVNSARPRSLNEWLDIAHACQDLISFASYSPCALLKITLAPEESVRESDNTVRSEIRVYTDNIVKGAPDEEAMTAWKTLFTLADVDFDAVMPLWFQVRKTLGPTCNMVLGLKYIPGGYLETKLLTAVGAAEVMAGALIEKSKRPLPIPPEAFTTLRQELVDLTPEKYRKWVKSKLQNTPTLAERLEALASIPDQEIVAALMPNVKQWAQRTAKARNDLAHRGRSDEVSYPEMAAAAQVAVAVVVLNLLDQLKIPTARVLQALEHHPDLENAPRLAKKYWPSGSASP